jgi:hypothetical protein
MKMIDFKWLVEGQGESIVYDGNLATVHISNEGGTMGGSKLEVKWGTGDQSSIKKEIVLGGSSIIVSAYKVTLKSVNGERLNGHGKVFLHTQTS